jgi:sterol desaturase/sphingolipid hydroxylase (fatty acid hydroxylase superfamily)
METPSVTTKTPLGVPVGLYRVAVSPWLICPLYLVVLAWLLVSLWRSGLSWGRGGALVVLGAMLVTFLEYLLHRFLLHGVRARVFFVEIHRRHHAFPNELLYAAVPLPTSLLLLGASAAAVYGVSGSREASLAVALGLVVGYLFHELTHYRIHHAKPRTVIGRWLTDNHLLHHHRDPRHNYGFSTSLWDHVLRSYRAPGEAAQAKRHGR